MTGSFLLSSSRLGTAFSTPTGKTNPRQARYLYPSFFLPPTASLTICLAYFYWKYAYNLLTKNKTKKQKEASRQVTPPSFSITSLSSAHCAVFGGWRSDKKQGTNVIESKRTSRREREIEREREREREKGKNQKLATHAHTQTSWLLSN